MKTYIEGKDGVITGFKMQWSFDAMTSAYMLDGEDSSSENEQEILRKVSASVLENLKYEHYFTYFYDSDTPIKYLEGHSAKLIRDKSKLVLSFDLPLSSPKPVTRDTLRLLIFEPSYYVDMTWLSKSDVVLSDDLSRNCQLELIEPNPTPEQMSYAMSLPAEADPDNALGELFTQTVKIHCATISGAN
jgi:tRNA threonylcarbamoyladenosine biosynthesis protein TsaE